MKKTILLFVIILFTISNYAQEITGQWHGLLSVQSSNLRLVFNIEKTDNVYTATMDSPDQNALGIPVTSINFTENILKIEISNAGILYEGILNNKSIFEGTFKQGGMSFPMDLSRKEIEKVARVKKPQEPTEPYPYYSENVTFENKKDSVTLAGTLSLPKKKGLFNCVILISGSGAQNRDEELLGHKPFLVISDYLTRNGIAVLRYDDRGTAASTGNFKTATSADFSVDVEAAISFLKTRKEINKIGLVGHSEGGMIAPIVASRNTAVDFIVLLAGPGTDLDKLLLKQQELIGKITGEDETEMAIGKKINTALFTMIKKSNDNVLLEKNIRDYLQKEIAKNPASMLPEDTTEQEYIDAIWKDISSPWFNYFIKFSPATYLEKVSCPVLALNGSKDLQVPAKENLAAIGKALTKGGNTNFTTKEFSNLNHLFQECETGNPNEYANIEQTFSPSVLEFMLMWIKE